MANSVAQQTARVKGLLKTTQSPRRRVVAIGMLIAAVLMASLVTADVILVYTSTTSIGNASNPFGWVQGANAATAGASGLGVASISCTTSAGSGQTCPVAGSVTPAYEIATTLNGVPTVTIEVLDLAEFENAAPIGALGTGHTLTIAALPSGVLPAGGITATNVVCAFAVISDFAPSSTALSSYNTGISGCTIVVPTVPASPDAACAGTGGAAGNTIMDLTLGTSVTTPAGGWTCSIPAAGIAAGQSELYVSYMIVTSGTSAGNLYGFGVQVVST